MPVLQSADGAARKQRGDYPTPAWLVELVVAEAVTVAAGRELVVVDPACGDGRFLVAAGRRVAELGGRARLVGCDVDPDAVRAATAAVGDAGTVVLADALDHDWRALAGRVDAVVGNPPYLSQLAATTTRGGSSRHGGGPYADAAVEFLALAHRLARPDGGRIGLVLPQSILASRDAAPVRAELDACGRITWSWWSPDAVFDARVLVCALVIELGEPSESSSERTKRLGSPAPATAWTEVVTASMGLPALPDLATAGTLAERCRLSANFRDQYYGLVPAVVDGGAGPPLVASGLIDPATCRWGQRPVTFARRRFRHPTVELDRLSPAMRRWADRLLVPKVLIANQTRVVEAVVDEAGAWLPGVPAVTARPAPGDDPWAVAAVLTSPIASRWAWQRAAGTGLSSATLRLGPRWLAELPWPRRSLATAITALRERDVVACGRAVTAAYGLDPDSPPAVALATWWCAALPGGG